MCIIIYILTFTLNTQMKVLILYNQTLDKLYIEQMSHVFILRFFHTIIRLCFAIVRLIIFKH